MWHREVLNMHASVIKHSALSGFSNQPIQKARKEPLFLIKDKLRAKGWAAAHWEVLQVRILLENI